jgi:predicted negative regulator of RcsB-dependent stress response
MALDLEEQEQLAALKAWWKQYGTRVVIGLAVVVIAIAGLRGWQIWSARQASEASQLFEQAMQAASLGDEKGLKEVTARIMENYSGSAYATPAAWLAGKHNHASGAAESAAAQYAFALEHARDDGLKALARLRLAAVRFDQGQAEAALDLLQTAPPAAFAGLHEGLRGDVLLSLGRKDEARTAYRSALEKLDARSPLRPLFEIKLDGLGG